MPSRAPLPTVSQLVTAGHRAVRGQRLATSDDHQGSAYDLLVGPSAILWRQQALRDRDLARSVYDDAAQGQDLSDRILAKTGIARYLDTYGVGYVILTRASASAGAGTIWAGSRIQVQASGLGVGTYVVTSLSPGAAVTSSQLSITVPIRASATGPGVAVNSTLGSSSGQVLDPLWDNSWKVSSIVCADGTKYEKAADYLARVRIAQRQGRVGFTDALVTACKNAGAQTVAVFPSGYAGNDYGMSAVYVGDATFTGTPALVRACVIALEGARILGAETHVGAMMPQALAINATVTLNVDPGTIDALSVTQSLQNACFSAFNSYRNGFAYSRDAMAGAMSSVQPSVQSVVFNTPTMDAQVMTGTPPTFPQTLTRYSVNPANVVISLLGQN